MQRTGKPKPTGSSRYGWRESNAIDSARFGKPAQEKRTPVARASWNGCGKPVGADISDDPVDRVRLPRSISVAPQAATPERWRAEDPGMKTGRSGALRSRHRGLPANRCLRYQDVGQRIMVTAPVKPDRTIVLIERANEGAQHFGHVHLSIGHSATALSDRQATCALNCLVIDFNCNVHAKTIAPCQRPRDRATEGLMKPRRNTIH